ncbi:MAG: hypothetical protein ACYT04_41915 [Nostoc sp.]
MLDDPFHDVIKYSLAHFLPTHRSIPDYSNIYLIFIINSIGKFVPKNPIYGLPSKKMSYGINWFVFPLKKGEKSSFAPGGLDWG